jgi:hypothetical protein
VRLGKSLMERLFKGKCVLSEEMQREEDVDIIVEYPDMKSKSDLNWQKQYRIKGQNQNQSKQTEYFHR